MAIGCDPELFNSWNPLTWPYRVTVDRKKPMMSIQKSHAANISTITPLPPAHVRKGSTITHVVGPAIFDKGKNGMAVGRRIQEFATKMGSTDRSLPNSAAEIKRATLLRQLKSDLGYFQQCFSRDVQPAGTAAGVRAARNMEPVLASLNASLGTNLVYCESQKELGALLDSVSAKAGDWDGRALVLMTSGAASKHFIGVHIGLQNGRLYLEAADSLGEDEVGFDGAYDEFKKVVTAREGIDAKYRSIPVQVTPNTCGFHSIHFLLAGHEEFMKRSKDAAKWPDAVVQSRVNIERFLIPSELALHVDTKFRMENLRTSRLLKPAPLPEARVGEPLVFLKNYQDAHMRTKTNETQKRQYDYSDSIERYMLSLLEGAAHWMKHAAPEKVLKGLANVRPADLGKDPLKRLGGLVSHEQSAIKSFRELPQHTESSAFTFWDPSALLERDEIPGLPEKFNKRPAPPEAALVRD